MNLDANILFKASSSDFPGGPVVKNLSCNARAASSIPHQGAKIPRAAEQLSLHTHLLSLPTQSLQATARVHALHDTTKIPRAATKI